MKNHYAERLNNLEKNIMFSNKDCPLKENNENLEKSNFKIRFSEDRLENSIMYTEIKKNNENKLSFKIKNKYKEDDLKTKRKKF